MERINIFDSLRGYCAFWVVFIHVSELFNVQKSIDLGFLYDGMIPVSIFFVLSGFVIAWLLEARQESYGIFLFRRYFRLAPVFVVLCIGFLLASDFILAELVKVGDPGRSEILERVEIFEAGRQNPFMHLLLHATMLHGFFDPFLPYATKAFIPPGWSITIEWQFYLIAPFLVAAFRKRKVTAMVVFILLVTGALMAVRFNGYFVGVYLDDFVVGIASYFLIRNKNVDLKSSASYALVVALMLVTFFTANYVCFIWSVFLFLAYIIDEGIIKRIFMLFFESKPAIFLGKISYSVYLAHMLVIYFVLHYIAPSISELSVGAGFMVYLLIVFTGCALFSTILYYTIELPCLRWAAKVARKIETR